MRRDFTLPAGTVTRLTVDCPRLQDNRLGDPTVRSVDLWVPSGQSGAGLPLLVDLVGYTGSGLSHTSWKNFGENVPERLDRLFAAGTLPPCVVAFPDCFTRLGGNQYINSSVLGPWMDALCQDIVPAVEQHLGCGGVGRRGVFGKSSGGFGALAHALLRPDFWAAAACHSGDMGFELCYLPDMPGVLRGLARHDYSVDRFMRHLETGRKVDGKDTHLLMILAMAASYDPVPDQPFGVRLPVTLDTCEIIPERWANWLAWDPLTLVQTRMADLKQLKGLWIDCGDRDQYNLVYGARRLHILLGRGGVPHEYEEFPDDHSGIDYRMDDSLSFLVKALLR
jgi:hypothetical protein